MVRGIGSPTIARDDHGRSHADLLGRPGRERVRSCATSSAGRASSIPSRLRAGSSSGRGPSELGVHPTAVHLGGHRATRTRATTRSSLMCDDIRRPSRSSKRGARVTRPVEDMGFGLGTTWSCPVPARSSSTSRATRSRTASSSRGSRAAISSTRRGASARRATLASAEDPLRAQSASQPTTTARDERVPSDGRSRTAPPMTEYERRREPATSASQAAPAHARRGEQRRRRRPAADRDARRTRRPSASRPTTAAARCSGTHRRAVERCKNAAARESRARHASGRLVPRSSADERERASRPSYRAPTAGASGASSPPSCRDDAAARCSAAAVTQMLTYRRRRQRAARATPCAAALERRRA